MSHPDTSLQTGAALKLQSIDSLLGERFHVPAFQRGYRWTPQQVEALLGDVRDFLRREPAPGRREFYCLQPIVVRRRVDEEDWEIVDGQQRLTTINLILRALEDRVTGTPKPYALGYATRPDLAGFLAAPNEEEADKDIDQHHVWAAYKAIGDWCDKQVRWTDTEIVKCLTGVDDANANVRVIWYRLDPNEKPNAVFVRLNVGKIALTNAELIRALLLRRDRHAGGLALGQLTSDQERIARDWDRVERRLHEPAFWSFLFSGTSDPQTRIEYLFDVFLRPRAREEWRIQPDDKLRVFLAFERWMGEPDRDVNGETDRDPNDCWTAWDAVQQAFRVFEDWFEDRVLYHLVGYLVAVSEQPAATLETLILGRRRRGRGDFEVWLRGLIWRRVRGGRIQADPKPIELNRDEMNVGIGELVDDADYGKAKGPAHKIRNVLLLFNVAGLLEVEGSTQRFEFEAYQATQWDIEHVRSVTEASPRDPKRRKLWLAMARNFVGGVAASSRNASRGLGVDIGGLLARMDAMVGANAPADEDFERAFQEIRRLSGEDEARKYDNNLANLVLLDQATNRSYKNAVFPVKRKEIIALDMGQKKGEYTYVPPATRNVFLKYYNPEADDLWLWGQDDQDAYREALHKTLRAFFAPLLRQEP